MKSKRSKGIKESLRKVKEYQDRRCPFGDRELIDNTSCEMGDIFEMELDPSVELKPLTWDTLWEIYHIFADSEEEHVDADLAL